MLVLNFLPKQRRRKRPEVLYVLRRYLTSEQCQTLTNQLIQLLRIFPNSSLYLSNASGKMVIATTGVLLAVLEESTIFLLREKQEKHSMVFQQVPLGLSLKLQACMIFSDPLLNMLASIYLESQFYTIDFPAQQFQLYRIRRSHNNNNKQSEKRFEALITTLTFYQNHILNGTLRIFGWCSCMEKPRKTGIIFTQVPH